jgi:hypothetical protein
LHSGKSGKIIIVRTRRSGIDGAYYWDGCLVFNTPLQWVLDSRPRLDSLIFQIDCGARTVSCRAISAKPTCGRRKSSSPAERGSDRSVQGARKLPIAFASLMKDFPPTCGGGRQSPQYRPLIYNAKMKASPRIMASAPIFNDEDLMSESEVRSAAFTMPLTGQAFLSIPISLLQLRVLDDHLSYRSDRNSASTCRNRSNRTRHCTQGQWLDVLPFDSAWTLNETGERDESDEKGRGQINVSQS